MKCSIEKHALRMSASGWTNGRPDLDVEVDKETLRVEETCVGTDKLCRVPERPTSAPMRMPVSGIYKIKSLSTK